MLILTLSDDEGKDSVYLLPLYFKSPRCQMLSVTYSLSYPTSFFSWQHNLLSVSLEQYNHSNHWVDPWGKKKTSLNLLVACWWAENVDLELRQSPIKADRSSMRAKKWIKARVCQSKLFSCYLITSLLRDEKYGFIEISVHKLYSYK